MVRGRDGGAHGATLTDIVAALSSRLRLPTGYDLVPALEKMERSNAGGL